MKLSELKKKFQHKYVIRVVAGVLTVALLGTGVGIYSHSVRAQEVKTGAVEAEENFQSQDSRSLEEEEEALGSVLSDQVPASSTQAGKEETVYVVADAAGRTKEIIVSEWLKNPEGKDRLEDASDLKDIKNVKGNETFTEGEDGTLTWEANGKDIYYQGTTDKELPVDVTVSYRLDGKEIQPQELAGKSGRVTIRMDYVNRETVPVKINGKEENISVPFTAVSGMILSDKFTNVEVTNGKVISDGKNQVVIGVAMPGLEDSLNIQSQELDADVTIPSYVEVTADVEDFSLNMTMTMLMSDVLSELNPGEELDLSDLEQDIDTLSDASTQLLEGTTQLKDGTGTLSEKSQELSSGAGRLAKGIRSYTDGVAQVAGGISTLKDKSGALGGGAAQLAGGINTIAENFTDEEGLLAGTDSLRDGAAQVSSGAVQLYAGIQGMEKAIAAPLSGSQEEEIKNQASRSVADSFQTAETQNAIKEPFAQQAAALQPILVKGIYQSMLEQMNLVAESTPQLKTYVEAAVGGGATREEALETVVWPVFQQQLGTNLSLQDYIAAQAETQMNALLDGVVGACRQSADQAAQKAAVEGAKGAKEQIAAQLQAANLAGNVEALKNGAGQVSDGAARLSAGTHTLYEQGILKMQDGIQGLAGSVPTLLDGISTLSNGSSTLQNSSKELTSGAESLSRGTGALIDGVKTLDEGAGTLKDGMEEFDQDGIQKLADLYHGDIQSFLDRLDGVREAGKSYHTFTRLPKEMDGTVKFIIRTEAIE